MTFGIDSNGNYGYIKAGADSVTPFSSYNVKTSTSLGKTDATTKSISITVPAGVKRGILICVSTAWDSGGSQSTPTGTGIKTISSRYNVSKIGICSSIVRIYECEFNEGGKITIGYSCSGNLYDYPTGHLILLA